jgi:hypothetical protein
MTEKITVGGLETSVEHAKELAWEYLNQYGAWSYPAYDNYKGNGETHTLGPEDTLAVALLNAGQKAVTSQYTFLGLLDSINSLLGDQNLKGTLDEAGPGTMKAIAKLYGVLDGKCTPEVKLIKLSKALHLKRPGLLPLYDDNIWRCYGKLGAPKMQNVRGRSNTDFMIAWLPKVKEDLQNGMQHWKKIAELAPDYGPVVTPLRALDIVAWRLVEEIEPRKRKRPRRTGTL